MATQEEYEATSLMDSIRITALMLDAGAATPAALERYRARYRRASAEARAGATRLLVEQGGVEADLLAAGQYLANLPEP